MIERLYAERFAPFLTRGRNALWVLAFSTLVGVICGYHALQLRAASRDVNVWPHWHNAYQYLRTRDAYFELSEDRVLVFWGVRGVDRGGVSPWDEDDLGRVVWDEAFDASDPEAQAALLWACETLPARAELRIAPESARCPISAFYKWESARASNGNVTWPIAQGEFASRFAEFVMADPRWSIQLSAVSDGNGNTRLRHLVASFTLTVQRHAPATELQPLYDTWQAAIGELNAAAPPTCAGALQANGLWISMAMQQLLMFYSVSVICALSLVGLIVLSIATQSLRIALCCTLTILNVVATFTGIMVWGFNLQLGMTESVVLMVSVGLMMDPLTHVAHAFNEAKGSRQQRISAALTSIGISVVAAALSTAGSCICLFFCTISIFSQFGELLCTLLLVTIIYTNTFLAPLLYLIGPSDESSLVATPVSQAVGVFTRCICACRSSPVAFRHRQFDTGGDRAQVAAQGGRSLSGVESAMRTPNAAMESRVPNLVGGVELQS